MNESADVMAERKRGKNRGEENVERWRESIKDQLPVTFFIQPGPSSKSCPPPQKATPAKKLG